MTIREAINQLEEPYRSQLLENSSTILLNEGLYKDMGNTLAYLFYWKSSPQGLEYWEKYETFLKQRGL